eukprot:m.221269 g.221269  ORF g.221269 m.221269 type:complete len:170 (+) comp19185_c0_seq1:142-651(+)
MADNAFADTAPVSSTEPYRHPKTVFAHLFFKTAAVLFYLFGAYFTTSFVVIFVMVTTLLSLDFWTVKNVTGRLLVGLRWWNKVAEDGSTEWVFESKKVWQDTVVSDLHDSFRYVLPHIVSYASSRSWFDFRMLHAGQGTPLNGIAYFLVVHVWVHRDMGIILFDNFGWT